MRRSKYGYLLLALLVITGLAGTITSTSPTSKERKFASNHLKDTKAYVMNSVRRLSPSQLDFKTAPDRWSIKECVYHLAISEKNFWQIIDAAMKQPPNPEKRSEIKLTDEQVIAMVEDRNKKVKTKESLEPKNAPFRTLDEALESFKSSRTEHIKYLKTTTEDLRNHVIQLPVGWVDCYQACLFMSAHSNRHTKQIVEVRADSNFPPQ
jgi:hypothetical protein